MFKLNPRLLSWQIVTLGLLIILFASPITQAISHFTKEQTSHPISVVPQVQAGEIYPMFTCPCCDQPLNKEESCCGAMTQMIDYIDQKISTGAGKDQVILATAQEFGLDRLTNKTDQEAIRDQLRANAPANAPQITIEQSKKDLGIVSQKDGTVTTTFTLKNEGQSDLIIDKLSSSCGCTSGSIVYQGEEGPRFYMTGHGYEEPDPNWQVAIAPGDEAQIKVYYDPTVHPDLTSPVTRTLSIHSNDPVNFESKVIINLDQKE